VCSGLAVCAVTEEDKEWASFLSLTYRCRARLEVVVVPLQSPFPGSLPSYLTSFLDRSVRSDAGASAETYPGVKEFGARFSKVLLLEVAVALSGVV
jgi:hypothetical protein